jgi:hypothetical protein
MNDEKIKYEPVPLDKLQEQDAFHANLQTPSDSLEYGGAALAGKGAYELAKRTPGVKKLFPEVTIGPMTTESGTTVPKTGGTDLTGKEKWNKTLTGNVATGSQMDAASLLKNQEMMKTIGPGGELAGGEIRGGNVIIGPDMKSSPKLANVGIPELAHLPTGSPEYLEALDRYLAGQPVEPPKPIPLTPAQRAMQVAQGIGSKAMGMTQPVMNALSHPIMQKLNPALIGLGYIGAGTSAKEAYERAQHGDYGRAAIDALGGVGTLASIHAPHPVAKVLGLGAGLGAHYLNKKLDEKYGRDYATGGLVYLGK